MKNYIKLIEEIQSRSNPENLILEKAFYSELQDITYGDVEKYIKLAMRGVEPEYTQRSKEAGKRVQNHLKSILDEVTYKYQGSVETDTHIKATSDIDLLVISNKSYMPDYYGINQILSNPAQKATLFESNVLRLERAVSPPFYSGNSLEDLKANRLSTEEKLKNEYIDCDCSKPKSVKITNRSLNRDVDIVIAGWFDDSRSLLNDQKEDYRGIQIYNKTNHQREDPDFPFLKIKLLNEKSSITNGRLKKMIRFLKNIKAEINKDQKLELVKMSSFKFNAICYDIDVQKYADKNVFELVAVLYWQLKSLAESVEHRNSLKSIDDSEFIFRDKPDKAAELLMLMTSINSIIIDLQNQKAL